MIEYKHVALRYTDKNILKDVNLRIENGEFRCLWDLQDLEKPHDQDGEPSLGADRWQYLYGWETHQRLLR